MAEESLIEWMSGARERLAYELEHGGTEAPCPFCKHPRCRRSDYTRCVRCGINWLDGEPLDRNPQVYRDELRRKAAGLGTDPSMPNMR